jgi:DEAD/DEAH box helicase domain-containing protein
MTDPFIDTLREKGAVDFTNDDGKTLHDKIETRILNAIEPEFCDKWPAINNILIDLLAKLNINKLYEYQYRAISNILNDEDVVLMAPTAGGKTLCYNLPIINDLMANASHRALYIYPMKALIADQRKQLLELTHPLREEGYNIESWVYDGDTPTEERRCIRNNPPQILLTNPEMVNYSLLQWADKWNISSFRNLKYIVIDEIHTYRGYFGSNMAHLLRRLLHFLALNDAKPVLVLSTATCANPEEHATQLTERDFSGKVVSAKRNMRAKKTLYFI